MTEYRPHVVISGLEGGRTLLLLNSLGTSTRMWEPQLPLLERHFRVIRMDTRGHGASPTPPAPYSFDDLVSDAFGVLDREGAETACVMGCSLGSMTALGMGLQAPERTLRIVCSAARADAPPPFCQMWEDRIATVDEVGVGGLWEGTKGVWFTDRFREEHPDTVEAMGAEFAKTTEEGYRGCAEALKGLDYLKDLGRVDIPILFVAGEHDKGAPPDAMREMAQAARHGKFSLIEDAGHIVNVGQPDAFTIAIASFLSMEPTG